MLASPNYSNGNPPETIPTVNPLKKQTLSNRFLDSNVVAYLEKGALPSPRGSVDKLPRVFAWFPNSAVPSVFHGALSAFIDFWMPVLRDPRDIMFVSHSLFFFVSTIPSALWMLLVNFSWTHAILHTIWCITSIPPFILMMHCIAHGKFGKKGYEFLDTIVFFVIAPFNGQTWLSFYFHHCKMHHVQDNSPEDLSSTIQYQRDNLLHFAHYFATFYFSTIIALPIYFLKRGKYVWALQMFTAEFLNQVFYASWFLVADPRAVIFAWTQHAFVDPNDPTNNYKSAITCVGDNYNQNCFNDGYHTSHHLNPLRHFDDHPNNFIETLEQYRINKTAVFKNIDHFTVWVLLMTHSYKTLASHYVVLEPKGMSEAQIIDYIKSRVKKFSPAQIQQHYPPKKSV